jgi:hypothetical protein
MIQHHPSSILKFLNGSMFVTVQRIPSGIGRTLPKDSPSIGVNHNDVTDGDYKVVWCPIVS